MNKLLKKEFTFTAMPLTYIFLAAAAMTMIPGYPILCGAFFVCLGIFYTFQSAREGNDILYTALLPVKKGDVVRARFYFVIAIELIAFMIMAALTALRMTVLSGAAPYTANPLMNANLLSLGFTLMIFAAFNSLFVGGFFKDAYRIGMPFLRAGIAIFVLIGIGETLHHIPGLESLNTPFGMMPVQLGVLAAGVLSFLIAGIFACKIAIARFERMDLAL